MQVKSLIKTMFQTNTTQNGAADLKKAIQNVITPIQNVITPSQPVIAPPTPLSNQTVSIKPSLLPTVTIQPVTTTIAPIFQSINLPNSSVTTIIPATTSNIIPTVDATISQIVNNSVKPATQPLVPQIPTPSIDPKPVNTSDNQVSINFAPIFHPESPSLQIMLSNA